MKTINYISIKNKDGEYSRYSVPDEVYAYIRQLENCINYPKQSQLEKLYPERFGKCWQNKASQMNIFKKLWLFFFCKHRRLVSFKPTGTVNRRKFSDLGDDIVNEDVELEICLRCGKMGLVERVKEGK